MKKHVMMAAMLLLAASCSNESEETVSNQNEQATAPVRVHVSDFAISMEEFAGARGFTRAVQNPADYFTKGTMILAFYDAEGTEVYKTTQVENEGIKDTIVEVLGEIAPATATMIATDPRVNVSNQKVSALLKQLVEVGTVTKVVDKGKSLFSLTVEE